MRDKQNLRSLENQKDELKFDVKVRCCASNCREIVAESEKIRFRSAFNFCDSFKARSAFILANIRSTQPFFISVFVILQLQMSLPQHQKDLRIILRGASRDFSLFSSGPMTLTHKKIT